MSESVLHATKTANGRRKEDHLRIALSEEVGFKGRTTGLEDYYFVHRALPELDKERINLSLTLFGKSLSAPIVISAMVGGIGAAARLNRNLASAAQSLGLAMAVGSQRCAIDDASLSASYQVREVAPDILLFANLGAVQLNYGYGVHECRRAVDMIAADALVLHLNPLQEALQPMGNTDFSGLLDKIARVCRELPVPVVVKEVGWGISEEVAKKLVQAGVSAIDTAGSGGTCWSEVERRRTDSRAASEIAATFACWGIPTADSIQMVRRAMPGLPLIASGGIRTGLDVAKAIALGADAAGIATPLLKAADESADAATGELLRIIEELRLAMFCTGTARLAELKFSTLLRRKA
ncbi:MAG: type 2 isopentenyl-diphosphate Delta-isomerase [Chloroflexi bacterium]|nr:type 2 isopentenyl-diphosphate Delta-isomerase [Chloroflexota bacterium]